MSDSTLEALVTGAHRRPDNIARNAVRRPVETLEFFGLKPDMTVLEILPALGWYTEILAPYLAEQGRLYVAHFSPDGILPYMPAVLEMFERRMIREPDVFAKVTVRHINPPARSQCNATRQCRPCFDISQCTQLDHGGSGA